MGYFTHLLDVGLVGQNLFRLKQRQRGLEPLQRNEIHHSPHFSLEPQEDNNLRRLFLFPLAFVAL